LGPPFLCFPALNQITALKRPKPGETAV